MCTERLLIEPKSGSVYWYFVTRKRATAPLVRVYIIPTYPPPLAKRMKRTYLLLGSLTIPCQTPTLSRSFRVFPVGLVGPCCWARAPGKMSNQSHGPTHGPLSGLGLQDKGRTFFFNIVFWIASSVHIQRKNHRASPTPSGLGLCLIGPQPNLVSALHLLSCLRE